MVCSNYRAISLLNAGYKIPAIILHITPYLENIIGYYPCGFRKKQVINLIFTIRQMQEKAGKFNQQLHNTCIDFRQAYNRVIRVELWSAITEILIPYKLIRLTKILCRKPQELYSNRLSNIRALPDYEWTKIG